MLSTTILEAITNNDISFFKTNTIDVMTVNEEGNPWLHVAAAYGRSEIIEQLLHQKADVNATNQRGFTALHVAVLKKHLDVSEILLRNGARIETNSEKDGTGWTPLRLAARHGYVDMIRLLIQWDASINAQDLDGYTCLHELADSGSLECLQLFLERGASVYIKNKEGQTPLANLLSRGLLCLKDLPKVLALLNYGSDVKDLFEYVEGDPYSASRNTLDSERVDLSPRRVIGPFFQHAAKLSNTMARYEVFIRFLLLGFVMEPNNTEAIKRIARYIKENDPEVAFEIDQHPILKAWGHITTTVTTLLEAKKIACTEKEIPEILYFMFSVYKRWPSMAQDEKNSAEYILTQSSKIALTDRKDLELRRSNPLYYLSRNKSDSSHVIQRIAEEILYDKIQKYTEHSNLSIPMLKRLCLELADPSSSFTKLLEEGPSHAWVEGPLLPEAQLSATLLSIRP